MTDIEIMQEKLNSILDRLSALNIYRQSFHVIDQWESLENGYLLTSLALDETRRLLEYLETCTEKLFEECKKRKNEKLERELGDPQ